jgi:hypothetical protein
MNDLDKTIEYFNFGMRKSVCVNVSESNFNKGVRDLLMELQEKREVEVQSAKKYLSNTPWKQMEHIESENVEEMDAFNSWMCDEGNRLELGMEYVDGQYIRQTALEILFTKEEIIELHRLVREKNSARSYHIKP